MDRADVQRAPRGRLQGLEVQQLLPGPTPDDALPVRAAGRLCHRLGRAVLALRPVLRLLEDLLLGHEQSQKRPSKLHTRVQVSPKMNIGFKH